MASSPSTNSLPPSIFNPALYTQIQHLWFQNLPPNATSAGATEYTRWFGLGATDAEKSAFDSECRDKFGTVLQALGPNNWALPVFESHDQDLEIRVARPLIREVENGEGEAPSRLLSLILLLDQMPRNIYRKPDEMPLVFSHFDRLSNALLREALKLEPSPVHDARFKAKPVKKLWLYMPLMHSEDIKSHDLFTKLMEADLRDVEKAGDEQAKEYIERSLSFEERHRDIIESFGRYPYRNAFLGRETTDEEREWLKEGDTFGVKPVEGTEPKVNVKDEL